MPGQEAKYAQPAGVAWYDFCVGRVRFLSGVSSREREGRDRPGGGANQTRTAGRPPGEGGASGRLGHRAPPPPRHTSHAPAHARLSPSPRPHRLQTLINAATTSASSFLSGVWPMGPANPLNNLFMRGWWGKVFYNDGSNPDVVQIWNLLYGNGTVDFDAIAYVNGTDKVTGDGKDSVFVDYALTDFAPFRSVIDEVRLVNAAENIYLGHIWASNPLDSLVRKGYKNRVDEVLYRGKLAALNSTWLDFVGWNGLDTVGTARGLPAEYFTLGWFVMQCIGPAAPKLKYAWTAYFISFLDIITGLYRPEAALPGLPYAPSKTPTRVGPGFPSPSYGSGTFPKLHIWPFKVSDIGQLGPNVTKIPAFKGEPVLGNPKLYPIVTEGINNWFGEGQPGPAWTPTDLELKAADIAKVRERGGEGGKRERRGRVRGDESGARARSLMAASLPLSLSL